MGSVNTTGMCVRRWERALCRPRWVAAAALLGDLGAAAVAAALGTRTLWRAGADEVDVRRPVARRRLDRAGRGVDAREL